MWNTSDQIWISLNYIHWKTLIFIAGSQGRSQHSPKQRNPPKHFYFELLWRNLHKAFTFGMSLLPKKHIIFCACKRLNSFSLKTGWMNSQNKLSFQDMNRAEMIKVLLSGESGTFSETVENMPEVTECVVSQMKFVPSK